MTSEFATVRSGLPATSLRADLRINRFEPEQELRPSSQAWRAELVSPSLSLLAGRWVLPVLLALDLGPLRRVVMRANS